MCFDKALNTLPDGFFDTREELAAYLRAIWTEEARVAENVLTWLKVQQAGEETRIYELRRAVEQLTKEPK
jgi:hypothetical protein